MISRSTSPCSPRPPTRTAPRWAEATSDMNTAQHFKICLRDHKNREMVFNVKPTTTWSKIKSRYAFERGEYPADLRLMLNGKRLDTNRIARVMDNAEELQDEADDTDNEDDDGVVIDVMLNQEGGSAV
ncbi:uncharacterized protein EHS24_004179 [Apiotrichum porosum]|uniref:Ubiquitin-like domain-containing protein n=1 Tax=Apiotrichum porosum TaxID=105984 RepID=A0A427Y4I6_9TREE|nr:uncharacterized protein EHS24_004179 [Apiotrichum porosum]RSH85992.1 hypothetical protein EHS24_004179 [Apiotrichum porosum]